jgi:hypothetical protein
MPNKHAIDWTPMTEAAEVRVGDVVSAEAGGMPIFRVVALDGVRAWLGGERGGDAMLMPLTAFRWRGHPAS